MDSRFPVPYNLVKLQESHILVVDDTALNRELIRGYLTSEGYKNVFTAIDGKDALEKIKEKKPDLVILDLVMPHLDGIEVIKILRNQPYYSQLPILVQTISTDLDQRKQAWNYGATDIISKPLHKAELLARVKVHLQNGLLIRVLEDYQRVTREEINRALELQTTLLPSLSQRQGFEEKYHLSIDSLFLPARFLSGDLWGMHEISPNKIMIWICDFAGKGISASLSIFRLHTLFLQYCRLESDPLKLMHLLNNCLIDLITVGQFCTCLIGIVDTDQNHFSYVSAGFTHPFVYNSSTAEFILGDGSGMPLGIVRDVTYEKRILPLVCGSSLVLYSDLMWDDQGAIPGISFHQPELSCFLKTLQSRHAVEYIRSHINTLKDKSFSDDLTLVEITLKK